VGLESPNGLTGVEHSFNSPVLNTTDAVRFTP
jgi:hypothetical protein